MTTSSQQIDKLLLLTLWLVDQQVIYLIVPLDVCKRVLENPQSASGYQSKFLKINSDIICCFIFSTNFIRTNTLFKDLSPQLN